MNNRVTGCTRDRRRPARRSSHAPGRRGRGDRSSRPAAGATRSTGCAREWPDTAELPDVDRHQPERPHAPARRARSGGAPRRTSPTSASTRCGRRSRSSSRPTSASSPRAAWARWASALPRGDRRGVRRARPAGRADRRRRRLPAQHPGARRRSRATGCRSRWSIAQQPLPRHGPPVPAELLRRALPVDAAGATARRLRRGRRRLRHPGRDGRTSRTSRRRAGVALAMTRPRPTCSR